MDHVLLLLYNTAMFQALLDKGCLSGLMVLINVKIASQLSLNMMDMLKERYWLGSDHPISIKYESKQNKCCAKRETAERSLYLIILMTEI